ncbi:MAG: hypothetical protein ACI85J_000275, partial [Candidatus Poriferisodalaceae bacterium]
RDNNERIRLTHFKKEVSSKLFKRPMTMIA